MLLVVSWRCDDTEPLRVYVRVTVLEFSASVLEMRLERKLGVECGLHKV